MSDLVRLRVGGVLFEVEKSTLLRFKNTFFYGLFSSGVWQPEADGAYFVDRPAMGFDRILEYLRSGKLSVDGLNELEEQCLYSSLDYFLIPYKRVWHYTTQISIDGFRAHLVCELKDGRLCGAYEKDLILLNVDTSAIDMTMIGHTDNIRQFIQLQDDRVCSCSDDRTIKLWSIDSGLCELTLSGHTDWVFCIIQLSDGRVCSASWDDTLRVWNVSTGVCEMTMHTQFMVRSIAQLSGGRICCGDSGGTISIYGLLTGERELSWKAHTDWVNAIVYVHATRVCSGSFDRSIKVWNTAAGECERTLEVQTDSVRSMVLMHDGRLCSASRDGTLKLWNLETGECENTLSNPRGDNHNNVTQLSDGSLVSCSSDLSVYIWS